MSARTEWEVDEHVGGARRGDHARALCGRDAIVGFGVHFLPKQILVGCSEVRVGVCGVSFARSRASRLTREGLL